MLLLLLLLLGLLLLTTPAQLAAAGTGAAELPVRGFIDGGVQESEKESQYTGDGQPELVLPLPSRALFATGSAGCVLAARA